MNLMPNPMDRGRISYLPQPRSSTLITSSVLKLNRGTTAGENQLNVSITNKMRSFELIAS
jgi:hypothetical protein